jgi:hypothetical protein
VGDGLFAGAHSGPELFETPGALVEGGEEAFFKGGGGGVGIGATDVETQGVGGEGEGRRGGSGAVFEAEQCPLFEPVLFELADEPTVDWWIRVVAEGEPRGWLRVEDSAVREFGHLF